ncbi:MAG: tRNA (guanine(10)-N(2))-dimethyltransferase [Methanobacteriota archaeon]
MKYVTVSEGETTLKVPTGRIRSKRDPVFYNPVMEASRDISVAIARILKPDTYVDALAGSGARGIRIAREAGVEVTLNDLNPLACKLAKQNVKKNKLKVQISNNSSDHFLSDKKFDFVDIDPFGPPVRYLDAAIKAISQKGFLGVAATDTSGLCGRYPRACKRKYDSTSLRTDYYDELGLRILLGYIARNAIRYDFGVKPIFSHSTNHYMRVYAELNRGRTHVNKTQEKICFLQHCFKCLDKKYAKLNQLEIKCACGGDLSPAGPLWSGVFADSVFSSKIASELMDGEFNSKRESSKLAETISLEQEVEKPYFNLHKLCRVKKVSAPKTVEFAGRLEAAGFKISPTHFNDVGFRSDATSKDILRLL